MRINLSYSRIYTYKSYNIKLLIYIYINYIYSKSLYFDMDNL